MTERDKNSQQDWDDLNNELSGLEVGRLKRFVLGSDIDVYGETRKKKEERRHLSQIEQLLMDEAYQAALKDAMRSVHDTRSPIYDALKDSSQAINLAELRMRDLRENASTLPDGTLVFLDENGNAITVDKRQLSDEELAQVTWNDNAPRWEEYQQSLDERHALYLENGYEGTMVRQLGIGYEQGKRSKSLMKVKTFQDAEFEIIGVLRGKPNRRQGTEVGIYRCKTDTGVEFQVTAPGDAQEKHEHAVNGEQNIGRYLTVQFFNLTADGCPFHPVALRIREDV